MYAIIRTGGKQYTVKPGLMLDVEKQLGSAGDMIEFNDVLLVANGSDVQVGTPLVKGISVAAKIVRQHRGDKVKIFKKLRRHGYQLRKGHRQSLTQVQITGISG